MNQQHYMDYKLINFNVPNHLINSFDEMVKFKRVSRTSLLIRLMESWLRHEVNHLETDNKFNYFVRDMKLRNRTTLPLDKTNKTFTDDEDDLLPQPIFSSDDYNWEDRLSGL
jgi:hypothetical protein